MTGVGEVAAAFSRVWGPAPATVDLVAFAATIAPDSVAVDGVAGPVSFAQLNTQLSLTARVLAAQGIDTDAAVGAAVTPALPVAGLSPEAVAAQTRETVAAIRARALGYAGSTDLASLPGIFRSVAARFGERTALTDEHGRTVTYTELDGLSDDLAAGLLAAGAGPEKLVGVALPRSIDLVVALLAVVKTGAGYLPLDQTHPVDRLQMVVDDADPVLVLTDEATIGQWSGLGAELVTVAGQRALATDDHRAALPTRIDSAHPAYVMYTSGSTGRPKGVVISHADVVNLLSAMGREYDYSPDDVWAMYTSYAFDVSVSEVWVSLCWGGRLVVLDYLTTRTPPDLVRVLDAERVTVINMTPSAFYQLAEAVREPSVRTFPASVRSMILAGEALDFLQVRRWFADRERCEGSAGPQLNNMYGPTEATVYSTRRELTPDFVAATSASDIGAALPGVRAYVLDSRLVKAPDGVPGHLYLAGGQLARGYADRYELTATRFVADPFGSPGDRMYQTGDVALIRDGGIEYLGRADDQVKLRGFRIELGEVEAALLAADGVSAAAAAVHSRDGFPDQLVGYVTAGSAAGELVPADIKRVVAGKVPEYMVPDVITVLDELPLNVNGKLDRRALPAPVLVSAVEFVAPATDAEATLAKIFAEVLGLEKISVVESVFDMGGNSLLAARIVARVCDDMGVDLNLRDLFEAPTVRGFAERVAGADAGLGAVVAVVPRPARVPLSFAQARMWFINQLDTTSPAYNIPAVLRVSGPLDIGALRLAVGDLVARHEILRTSFPAPDGEPFQLVGDVAELDARDVWRVAGSPGELLGAISEGFDVTTDWPLRVRISADPEDASRHLLAVVGHHIGVDGESVLPLVSDLLAAYAARIDGRAPEFAPLAVQFADYAIWQHRALGGAGDPGSVVARQLAYWREQLAGLPDVLNLPADHRRPKVASYHGAQVRGEVPAAVAAQILEVARTHDATPFMVVHAALAVLLARLSATHDIAVATPIAGRGQAVLEPLVGMFVNTLVLRTQTFSGETFTEFLHAVRGVDLDAFGHSEAPFESVVEALDPVRSEAFSPLAQVLLSFDPAASAAGADIAVGGLEFSPVGLPVIPAQLDLSVIVSTAAAGDPWSLALTYATDLFTEPTAATMLRRFVALLEVLTADPGLPVGEAGIVDAAERSAVLAASQGSAQPVPPGTVVDVIGARAVSSPDSPALRHDSRTVTYAEFGSRVNTLARQLITLGVGPDTAVAVLIDRSVELLVAVHAVLAAGGQYVPIAADAPAERVRYMLDTAGAGLVLVAGSGVTNLPEGVGTVVVDCSGEIHPDSAAAVCDAERLAPLRPDHAAYTLFTSGSTGQPKGVTVSHRALRNRLEWMREQYGLSASDVFVQKTPATFDVSVWELLLPLVIGSPLVIAAPGRHGDADYLAALVRAEQITVMHFVPSMLSAFTDVLGADGLAELTSLRVVFTSGEALGTSSARALLTGVPAVRLINLYGPTEAAVDVTAHEARVGDEVIPIGTPVPNTTTLVLDERLHPVPPGVIGELYLGGVQLARGYAARPDLTAERFVADPLGPDGGRLYRTGDLVRWTASDALEYLGRTDFQVKLRGQRLELGEVEAVLAAAPGVVHAAAAVVTTPAGDQVLAGYLTPADVDVAGVTAFAALRLPEFMVPTAWVPLADVPLSASGKLDRKLLPEPEFGVPGDDFTEPASDAEELVAQVFADVLGVDRVSVTSSFFDLGGNSLAAMRLAARAGDALGVTVTVRDVFSADTVRGLVAEVAGHDRVLPPITAIDPRPDVIPLSFAQARLWFINQFDPTEATYNVPAVLRLTGSVDTAALREAVRDVIARHEVLRTSFPAVDGEPRQVVGQLDEFDRREVWRVVDSEADIVAAVSTGFDVSKTWPLRVRLYEQASGEYLLAVVAHHIAVDGESMPPLVADVVTAFAARSGGAAPAWEPLPVQFADFAVWQHRVLGDPEAAQRIRIDPGTGERIVPDSVVGRQLERWRDRLDGLPEVLDIAGARPRPVVASHRGARVGFTLPAAVGAEIDEVARRHRATPFMVVHAALAVLLSRLSATDDIAIAAPVAGRGQQVLDPLVGMFVNTLVLRTQVDQHDSFTELLRQVRGIDLDAYANADVPFEVVVEALNPVRSEAFSPLAQVSLSFDPQAGIDVELSVAGVRVQPLDPPSAPAKLDIEVVLSPSADGTDWAGSITYATDLFDDITIAGFAERLVRLLDGLTADPDAVVGDADLMTATDERRLLDAASGGTVDVGADSVTGLLRRCVASAPEQIAVCSGDRSVSYAELGDRVNALARELISVGVGPDTAVGIRFERSVEMVVAVHAVWAAGGQFVPIAPDAPADRVGYILATSGASVLLTGNAAGAAGIAGSDGVRVLAGSDGVRVLAGSDGVRMIAVDCSGDAVPAAPAVTDVDRNAPLRPDNAAYTMFTSGSTGRPKGVTVSHRSLMVEVCADRAHYGFGPDDVFLQALEYTFDPAVLEFVRPIIDGTPLVLLEPGEHRDPQALAAAIARFGVTAMMVVPSLMAMMAETLGPDLPGGAPAWAKTLAKVSVGGEALPPSVAAQVTEEWSVGVHNQYGPTETTIYSTISEFDPADGRVTIGRPVPGMSAYVLDTRLHPVPAGVSGELYLGGAQTARGYASAPAMTADRFVADPFSAGGRLYRTGDIVRHNDSGDLEYLGRRDFQVKLRGQRIELGEIETVLSGVPGVVHAAAAVVRSESGAQHLVGYLAPADVSVDSVKSHAVQLLPEFMVPEVWLPIDEWPTNAAGKTDRSALPSPDLSASVDEYVAPASDIEAVLAGIFADVTGLDRFGVTTSFFDAGGNSLLAMRLASRAGTALAVRVSVRDVFEAPTVRGLIAATAGNAPDLPPVMAVVPRPERLPLSSVQRRMWFVNQFDTASSAYNIPLPVRIKGTIDVAAVRGAVLDTIGRHEVLRTRYPSDADGPYQQIADAEQVAALLDWQICDSRDEALAAAGDGFDVTTDLPLRVRIWQDTAAGITEVLIVAHHIAFDGGSGRVFIADLTAAYVARTAGATPGWEPLPVQYADYSLWQQRALGDPGDPASILTRELAYWQTHLDGLPAVTDLPMDRPRPAVADPAGAVVRTVLPDDIATAVARCAGDYRVTSFMVFHAALAVTVARLAATTDVVIASPIDGRTDRALENLVGMFVNTLVLRTRIDPGASVGDVFDVVRRTDLDAFGHADVLFEQLVERFAPQRSTAYAPLAQVSLTHTIGEVELGEQDAGVEPILVDSTDAKVDVMVSVAESAGHTRVEFTYASSLFDEATIERFAEVWLRVLAAIVTGSATAVGDIDIVTAAPGAVAAPADGDRDIVTIESGTLVDLIAHRDLDPAHPALIFGDTMLDYVSFERRTNRAARALIARGAGSGDVVVIDTDSPVDRVVACWGAIKAGAACLTGAADRAASVSGSLHGVGSVFVVTEQDGDNVPDVPIAASELRRPVRRTDAVALVADDHPAGGDGWVVLTHQGAEQVSDECRGITGSRVTDPDTRVLVTSPTDSVAAWVTMIAGVMAGHTLVLSGDERHGAALGEVLAAGEVTDVWLEPSVLASIDPESADAVRNIVVLGGRCGDDIVTDWWARGRRIFTAYGPAGAWGWATRGRVARKKPPTAGKAIGGVVVKVLDERLAEAAAGEIGDVYVSGEAVARGLFIRMGDTAVRFVADPAGDGVRMYATGMRGRLNAGGDLAIMDE